jgi:hypothetical protein
VARRAGNGHSSAAADNDGAQLRAAQRAAKSPWSAGLLSAFMVSGS